MSQHRDKNLLLKAFEEAPVAITGVAALLLAKLPASTLEDLGLYEIYFVLSKYRNPTHQS